MISTLRWIGIAALGITLTGCVSQDQYSALKLERDSIAEQLTSAQRDTSTANSLAAAYKSQLDSRGGADSTTGALMGNLQAQNQTLQAQLEDMNRRYSDAMKNVGSGQSALPPVLTNELNAFAQQNPDLVDFDSARGIVKFKSDVTFNVGDATVTAAARAVIDKFAKILSSGSASGYELLVAGHTDSAPVHSQATISAGHKDNWYLSSHRAIAVANELMKNGVNSARVGVVGYADQRPAASNSSESGKAQNRRVEVLLLPSTIRPQMKGDTATGPRKDSAKTANSKMNKDGTIAAPGPILNK
jgi:chemotaxis protein MotB